MKKRNRRNARSDAKLFLELSSLFFATRQILRSKLPEKGKVDHNAWMRFETLRFIGTDGADMHEIAAHLHIKAPSATSLVRTLMRSGYVRRGKSRDRRSVRVLLSAKGARELRAYERRSAATLRSVFQQLGDKKTKELSDILRHVRDIHETS